MADELNKGIGYATQEPPTDAKALPEYLSRELRRIEIAINANVAYEDRVEVPSGNLAPSVDRGAFLVFNWSSTLTLSDFTDAGRAHRSVTVLALSNTFAIEANANIVTKAGGTVSFTAGQIERFFHDGARGVWHQI